MFFLVLFNFFEHIFECFLQYFSIELLFWVLFSPLAGDPNLPQRRREIANEASLTLEALLLPLLGGSEPWRESWSGELTRQTDKSFTSLLKSSLLLITLWRIVLILSFIYSTVQIMNKFWTCAVGKFFNICKLL